MAERAAAAKIAPELLALLVCPLTHLPLREAGEELLARLHLDAALVRADGAAAYPIRNGIPVLLPEEVIRLDPPAT